MEHESIKNMYFVLGTFSKAFRTSFQTIPLVLVEKHEYTLNMITLAKMVRDVNIT